MDLNLFLSFVGKLYVSVLLSGNFYITPVRGLRGRDRMVVGFLTTGARVIVFNATFNNISVISWQSVFLVEETGVPRETPRPATSP
jgi:hypothetical protein